MMTLTPQVIYLYFINYLIKQSLEKPTDKEKFIAGCNFVGLLEQSKDEWLSFKKGKIKILKRDITY